MATGAVARVRPPPAVLYSFEYVKFMLTVQTIDEDRQAERAPRFQQNGIYRTMHRIPLGGRGTPVGQSSY